MIIEVLNVFDLRIICQQVDHRNYSQQGVEDVNLDVDADMEYLQCLYIFQKMLEVNKAICKK